jgi:hypothetical protein
MAKKTNSRGIAVVVLVAGLVAGCAASGTVKKLTPADASLLSGTWAGWIYSGQAPDTTATLIVRPDGTYSTEAGAFSSTGKTDIKDGYVQFMSTGGTGGLAAGDRSGSATLMDKGGSWGLVGSGYGSISGPYSFNFSKTK